MTLTDVLIPLAGAGLLINAAISASANGIKIKEVVDIVIGIVICGLSIYASVDNSDKAETQEKATKKLQESNDTLLNKSDSLRKQLKELSMENDSIQKSFQDSLNSHYKNEVSEIQNTAYTMTKIFAENTKKELSEHSKTQNLVGKIDTSKLKPADIQIIPEPHNALKYICDSLSSSIILKLQNLGDRIAYNISYDYYFIANIDNTFFQLGDKFHDKRPTFSPDIVRDVSGSFKVSTPSLSFALCNDIKELYVFVIGQYYLDDN